MCSMFGLFSHGYYYAFFFISMCFVGLCFNLFLHLFFWVSSSFNSNWLFSEVYSSNLSTHSLLVSSFPIFYKWVFFFCSLCFLLLVFFELHFPNMVSVVSFYVSCNCSGLKKFSPYISFNFKVISVF